MKCCQQMENMFPAEFFKALSDPNRLQALFAFARFGRGCTVSEVAECCPTEFSVTSRHLAQLKQAGILSAEKEGRHVRYHVNTAEVARILRACADALETCCPPKGESSESKTKASQTWGNPPGGVPGIY